jgi:hypothetical protein
LEFDADEDVPNAIFRVFTQISPALETYKLCVYDSRRCLRRLGSATHVADSSSVNSNLHERGRLGIVPFAKVVQYWKSVLSICPKELPTSTRLDQVANTARSLPSWC